MQALRQIFAVTAMNFKSLPARAWSSLVIIAGMACVIGVLLSMLSYEAGLMKVYAGAGDPTRAIILSKGGSGAQIVETGSSLPRNAVPIIMTAPGIAKAGDGKELADAGIVTTIPMTKKLTDLDGSIVVRGLGSKGIALHPEFKLIAGRMFRPGTHELIVGITAPEQFNDVNLGDKVALADGQWPIVGMFTAEGNVLESQLIGDSETIMPALKRNSYNSVLLRLADAPDSFDKLKKALTTNPSLSVTVERHSDYYVRYTGRFSGFLRGLSYIIGTILAFGALFGAVNTMYSAVSARQRDIATLRALGFNGSSVAFSVLAECLFLALVGALIGTAIAWLMFDGKQHIYGSNVFNLTVTPGLVALGLAWAMIIALLGGLLPAMRAVRLPVVDALRAK